MFKKSGPLGVYSIFALGFLVLPILIVVPMSFSASESLEFPPSGFSLRWYNSFFQDARWLSAMRTSALVAALSGTFALLLGSLAAYGLVRSTHPIKNLLRANFIAPMIIPPVISAVGLYFVFVDIGLVGTLYGLVLAHTIAGVPFVILFMSVAISGVDVVLEHAAVSLGASQFRVLVKIVLPNVLTAFFASWLMAFLVSFDELILAIFLAGRHDTIPKKMFNELILRIDPTITAIATLLIGFTIVVAGVAALLLRRRNMSLVG